MKIEKIIHVINLPKHITTHLVGKNHTHIHRKITGATVMVIGVSLVKLSMFYDSFMLHFIAEMIGYGIHGIGLIPFVENISQQKPDECVGENCPV